jgi:hypothetical protein
MKFAVTASSFVEYVVVEMSTQHNADFDLQG